MRDRTSAGASRLDYTYTYDKHANITAIADGVATNKENRSLQYDARDRMTQATAPNQAGAELYDYDILDNVRRAAMTPDGLGGYVQDYRYLYDANHRLYRIDNAAGTQQWGFTHNTFGETLTRAGNGKNWSYQWNAPGRMTQGQQVYAGTTWETYTYDAHGRRTLSTRNTGTTRHQVYNRAGQLLYVEDTRDNQRIDYIHLGGKLVAQRSRPISTSTATVTYHHTDHIQSANVETNTSGTQTYRSLRAPYGDPYNGIYREGPGFGGHATDTQTNLTYMQQRYYDPVALRFLSPDPVHVSATDGSNFNRYWYANNNPYKFTDPDGRRSIYIGGGADKDRTRIVQDYAGAQKKLNPGRDVQYFSYREKAAISAAISAPLKEGEPLNVIGHSLGGREAIKQANSTEAKITNLVTIDPVGSAGNGAKPSNVEAWTNVLAAPSDRNSSDTVASAGRTLFGSTATSGA
ncbi:RHS repeat-associated core domain-containing protein, partial [Xanthomonadaceae bacterium JHOS43]|nr:RHS repeat-associated core domain-containing protein [Xanthomonadaceae bacterium JHOS43]